MLPIWALMAGAGLLKGATIDQGKENRARKLAAATQRYSPWTKMQAGAIPEADPLGSTLAFGITGKQIEQNLAQDEINKQLVERAARTPMSANYNFSPGNGAWSPARAGDPYSVWGSMNNMGN